MRVELLQTIRGRDDNGDKAKWLKGRIFDDNEGGVPKCIKEEVAIGSRSVRLLHDPKGNPIGELQAGEIEAIKAELQAAQETIVSLRKEISELSDINKGLKSDIANLHAEAAARSQSETVDTDTASETQITTNATSNTYRCPVQGCTNDQAFSEKGLKMHITRVHPEEAGNYYQD